VILVTALSEAEDKTKGFEAGAVDFINRPFDAMEVQARVRTHIALRKATETLEKQNQFLEDIVHRRTKQLRSILDLSLLLNSERNLKQLFNVIVRKIARIMGADRASLFLLGSSGKKALDPDSRGTAGPYHSSLGQGTGGKGGD